MARNYINDDHIKPALKAIMHLTENNIGNNAGWPTHNPWAACGPPAASRKQCRGGQLIGSPQDNFPNKFNWSCLCIQFLTHLISFTSSEA